MVQTAGNVRLADTVCKKQEIYEREKEVISIQNIGFPDNNQIQEKTYYFRVRTYKNSGRRKVYGKWSKIVKVKIRI